jgi:hypothetical protein
MVFGKFHFTLSKQVDMITGHGEQVAVLPCLTCPCLRLDQQFDPNCITCGGDGRFYPPSLMYATTMLLTYERAQRDYPQPGTVLTGNIRASLLPGIALTERDKVRRIVLKDRFSDEVLLRGLDDRVRFQAGVELHVVADRGEIYVAGRDYVLLAPNTVSWVAGGHAPTFGQKYSVAYEAHAEYLVVPDAGRARAEGGIAQSSEVVLMRLDMVYKRALAGMQEG